MIIVLGISKQEDIGRPEKPLEKTRENDNEARISKKAENAKNIQLKSEADNSVRDPAKLSNILVIIKNYYYKKTLIITKIF